MSIMKITPKTILRWCLPGGIYEGAHWIKSTLGRAEPGVGEWVQIAKWRETTGVWERYTLRNAAAHVAKENLAVEQDGITALEKHEAARAYFLAFAYVIARASAGRTDLSVLDFGGNLGAYSLIANRAAPGIRIRYSVRELPAICGVGRELRPGLHFIDADAGLARSYDVVFASGALQYLNDWRSTLALLADRAAEWLYVTRLPILFSSPSTIVDQRFENGTAASWLLNRDEFLSEADRVGMHLMEEIRFIDGFTAIAGAAELPQIRGYLFKRR